jgi:glucose-1-phosphate thymidylyltransferase
MKVIIPVAGEGKRLRPFTFTKPKPLIPVAGKPMLDHIMEQILPLKPTEVTFITGHLKEMIEEFVHKSYGAQTRVRCIEQKELIGAAGAVWLSRDSFDEDVLIDFGDTIFDTDLNVIAQHQDADGIIWVLEVDDPSRFGVLVPDESRYATRIVEKPKEYVSNLANIGLYYIKNTKLFDEALKQVIENKQEGREVYVADALQYMIEKGAKLKLVDCPGWFDCGTPEAVLDANRALLPRNHRSSHESNNIIIPPVSINPNARIENCIIGPHASVGAYAVLKQATIANTIVDERAVVEDIALHEMIVGEGMVIKGAAQLKN